ncbi:MAG: glutamine amidotransferase [Rudaea sp.]
MAPRKSGNFSPARLARRRLLIVQTGTAPTAIRQEFGDFAEWFRRGLGLTPDQIECVRVDRGKRLPAAESVAAALITGSAAMVTQRLAWSERTAEWVVHAAATGLPVLGVCYGHQLLAHAFGGRVGNNPKGREIGSVTINVLPSAKDDALFGSRPACFSAQATHLQTVVELPRDAVVLAESDLDACQIVRYAKHVWGVQFHPEFGGAQMRAYLRARAEVVAAEGLNVPALLNTVRASPEPRTVLRDFARLACR